MPTELHLALQQHYARDTGVIEARRGRYRIDVLRDDVAYEIQTGSFHQLRQKIETLSQDMHVVVVYPLPWRKTIVRVAPDTGEELSARKSPKRGSVLDVFADLRDIARLLAKPNISLEIVKTIERELRCDDGKGSYRRRGVSVVGRELVEILETLRFDTPPDYLTLLPSNLPAQFTVADLAQAAGINRWLAGHMAYTLYHVGATCRVGKRGNAHVYEPIRPSSGETPGDESGWVDVRCSNCGLTAFETREGSIVRWRCAGCRSLEVWPPDTPRD